MCSASETIKTLGYRYLVSFFLITNVTEDSNYTANCYSVMQKFPGD